MLRRIVIHNTIARKPARDWTKEQLQSKPDVFLRNAAKYAGVNSNNLSREELIDKIVRASSHVNDDAVSDYIARVDAHLKSLSDSSARQRFLREQLRNFENRYADFRKRANSGGRIGPNETAWSYSETISELGKRLRGRDAITSKEIAYGEGYHSVKNVNPYTDPEQKAEWERGRQASKLAAKLRSNYRAGELPGRRFQPPRDTDPEGFAGFHSPNEPDVKDFKSERGYVVNLRSATGSNVGRSPPFISERSAQRWLQEQIEKFAKSGRRVFGSIALVFYDPALEGG